MTDEVRVAAAAAVEHVVLLRVTGSLDAGSAPEVVHSLHDAVAAAPGSAPVVLDLRELDLLSAAGARALSRFASGNRLRVRTLTRPGSVVARVWATVAAAARVPQFGDLGDALRPGGALPAVPAGAGEDWPAEFESLTRTLLGDSTVADALRHIVDAAERVVDGADLVSITLLAPDGEFSTPVGTSPVGGVLDHVQYRSGEGPCVSAALPEGPGYVFSDDLRTEARWPSFSAAAASHGFRAIIATALHVGDGPAAVSGALNLYSRRPHGLNEADRTSALLLATHASLALAHTRTAELAELERASARRAISSRDVIGQAKGILMNRRGITADEAFDLLRRASQELNVKLVDLARTLAARHTDLDAPR
jgi:hypothetical protein